MISLEDVYKIVSSMVPLYVALMLGYGSIKWWKIINPQHVDSLNKLVCYFILPLFTFDFVSQIDPFHLNFKLLGADCVSKGIIVIILVLRANCARNGSYNWSITSYSLATMNNTLIVGVPFMNAVYGKLGRDLVVQLSVIQFIFWTTILLFVLEVRRSKSAISPETSPDNVEVGNESIAATHIDPSSWYTMKNVAMKLIKNPNFFACFLGLIWALIASRWHFKMPIIVAQSIEVMSHCGTGTAMFNLGIFMALQKKIISCGAILTIYGMLIRFLGAPLAMGIGAVALGLRGDVLRIAVVQATLPQSVITFVFAKEYGLRAEVISTAVILGTMASLPVLIAYYAISTIIH